MSHLQNITRIKTVYNALEELASQVIFIGGAVVSLYADKPSSETRPTDDVDILVELLDYKQYSAIEEKLRSKGFINDMESGIICRYKINGIIVDVMPTSEKILGFSNKWYLEASANSNEIKLEGNYVIRVFSPVYFVAVKLEAYKNRGGNDGRTSSDFEDIIFVLNNRNAIWDELKNSNPVLKKSLQKMFKKLLEESYLDEWISCHLDFHEQKRIPFLIGGLMEFVK